MCACCASANVENDYCTGDVKIFKNKTSCSCIHDWVPNQHYDDRFANLR